MAYHRQSQDTNIALPSKSKNCFTIYVIFLTFLTLLYCRYLDNVTNKDSTLPPIPHLHSLLTDNGEPHPEVDIFKLVRSSYEVFL